MRPFSRFLVVGAVVATIAGVAVAAERDAHVLNVVLPDGSVERIHYVGNVAPHVVLAPTALLGGDDPFAMFDAVAARMDAQADAMLRQVSALRTTGVATDPAALAKMPAGSVRYSYTSFSSGDGKGACRQSVQVTSFGGGQQPKVVKQSDGDCSAMNRPAATPAVQPAAPATPAAALTHVRYETPQAPAKPRTTI